MRFMLLMIPKGYEVAQPGTLPDSDAIAAMMKFNESMQEAGVLKEGAGLHPPSIGARVRFKAGTASVENGPFEGVTETLGGYWIIEVASRDAAVAWATKCPASDNEIIEIRQMQSPEDFE